MQSAFTGFKAWTDGLRRTHPVLWHLNTVPVVAFSIGACLLAFVVAILVPVDDKAITPVELIFFPALTAGFILTLWWVGRLLRPLWPAQSSTSSCEPALSAC